MVVVDTNVVAYLLIHGDRTTDAQALYASDPDWRSDGFVLIEFSNILATYQRTSGLTANAAASLLSKAEQVLTGLMNLPHARALAIAAEFGVAVYDARFLGAAQAFQSRLVTEDTKLRAAAPRLTRSLKDALAR
ncbi:MAG: type II toxin-antitoxin system VapC family toxin [Burkholderiales bacterium]